MRGRKEEEWEEEKRRVNSGMRRREGEEYLGTIIEGHERICYRYFFIEQPLSILTTVSAICLPVRPCTSPHPTPTHTTP